jgi:hypothetical protein
MRTRIDRLLERQAEDLARLESGEAKRFLSALEDSRRDLAERLRLLELRGGDKATPFTAQQMRVAMVQIEDGIAQLRVRLVQDLGDDLNRMRERAAQDLIAQMKAAEPAFRDAGGGVEVQVLRRLNDERGLLLHRYSAERYTAELLERIQRQLVIGTTTGETFGKMRDRIFREGGGLVSESRAALIVRMEMNSAYNRAHQAAYEELSDLTDIADDDDPMLRRLDEHIDVRNHAISRVLDDQVRGLREPFQAPAAEVQAELKKLNAQRKAVGGKKKRSLPKRGASGIVWPLVGDVYVGMNLPAHYWERGRQVAHRASWETHRQTARSPLTSNGPRVTMLGQFAELHEGPQAIRMAKLLGGGTVSAMEPNNTPGIDGHYRDLSGKWVPFAMSRFKDAKTFRSILRKIVLDSDKTINGGFQEAFFFGEVHHLTAVELEREILRREPLRTAFQRIILKGSDRDLVVVDSKGVRRTSSVD